MELTIEIDHNARAPLAQRRMLLGPRRASLNLRKASLELRRTPLTMMGATDVKVGTCARVGCLSHESSDFATKGCVRGCTTSVRRLSRGMTFFVRRRVGVGHLEEVGQPPPAAPCIRS